MIKSWKKKNYHWQKKFLVRTAMMKNCPEVKRVYKLIILTGIICLALGIGFVVVHQMAPSLSDAYLSGGVSSVGIGSMILAAAKIKERKSKELLR